MLEKLKTEQELEVSDFFPQKNQVLRKMCDFFSNFRSKNQIKKKSFLVFWSKAIGSKCTLKFIEDNSKHFWNIILLSVNILGKMLNLVLYQN